MSTMLMRFEADIMITTYIIIYCVAQLMVGSCRIGISEYIIGHYKRRFELLNHNAEDGEEIRVLPPRPIKLATVSALGFCIGESIPLLAGSFIPKEKVHPETQSYRTNTLLNYKDLCIIYGNETANGTVDYSVHDVNLDSSLTLTIPGALGGLQSSALSLALGEKKPGCLGLPFLLLWSYQFEGMDEQDPPITDRLKTKWTPPMD
ncbi:hypothetical protein NE237_021789 [Protea cynaroides]|uniref:Uncharacterized protein n=1 Tax=Protea cynaroides TaxID=273540 RepID=A0A9Q0K2X8_9MAGN|nr:hypothetical protein NE237_021789 [Protea cynaroides]